MQRRFADDAPNGAASDLDAELALALELPPEQQKYMVPAVTAAARILQYLAGYQHSHATLAEISSSLELNKTTCFRILRTLHARGLVHYDEPAKTFSLGMMLFVLGSRAAEHVDELAVALSYLDEVAEATSLTSVLVRRYGVRQHMYVAKREPSTPIRVAVTVGQHFPLTAGAHGKCMLAFMEPRAAARLVKATGLPRFTARSITSQREYLAALEQVRSQGYAVSDEEHYDGISGASAPIFDAGGELVLALSAFGVNSAIPEGGLERTGERLREVADRISRKLGASLAAASLVDEPRGEHDARTAAAGARRRAAQGTRTRRLV